MNRAKFLIILAAVTALLVLTAACAGKAEEAGPQVTTSAGGFQELSFPDLAGASIASLGARGQVSFAPSGADGSLEGILVSGRGTVTADPDLAILSLGVQATADTVKEALEQANISLNAMLDALKRRGIKEKDAQTRHFSINPRYDHRREGPPILTGYQVTNQLSVKIRDLDSIGPIIDESVKAGGNPVQINGISFTVEDTSALSVQAREAAVKATIAQAEQFAQLTGVQLGRLVHISQVGGVTPVARVAAHAFALDALDEAAAAPTQVRAGETEVSVTVQALFSIQ